MDICIDFDGTCVTHEYPDIGRNIGAARVLKYLVERNHNLILWTMRSGRELSSAIEWFKNNDIKLYGVNVNPTQHRWTNSNKAYGQLYIDDAALGAPLVNNGTDRPYIDWNRVEIMLKIMGV